MKTLGANFENVRKEAFVAHMDGLPLGEKVLQTAIIGGPAIGFASAALGAGSFAAAFVASASGFPETANMFAYGALAGAGGGIVGGITAAGGLTVSALTRALHR